MILNAASFLLCIGTYLCFLFRIKKYHLYVLVISTLWEREGRIKALRHWTGIMIIITSYTLIYAKCFTWIISFNSKSALWRLAFLCHHFTDEGAQAWSDFSHFPQTTESVGGRGRTGVVGLCLELTLWPAHRPGLQPEKGIVPLDVHPLL